jgi:hypothetical protein
MARARIPEAEKQDARSPQSTQGPDRTGSWFTGRKLAVTAAAALLLVVFCAYRIFTFVPQPLDSPGTLRPQVWALFSWFVQGYESPDQAQQAWATWALFSVLLVSALAWMNYLSRHSAIRLPAWVHQIARSRALFFGAIAVSLLICRFPTLLIGQSNPDEPLFIVAADKLFRDFSFFRAVNLGTSGPFNIYPLMLPALFGITPDYASARLVALLAVFVSVYVIYRTFLLLTDDGTARIALLPTAGAFAVYKNRDALHYASEYIPLVLCMIALYVCVKVFLAPQSYKWKVVALGVVASVTFLTKMQAVPIIGCISIAAIAYVYASGKPGGVWRPVLLFAAGLAPLLVLNGVICLATGAWNDFWMGYIVSNYQYTLAKEALNAQISQFADFVLGVADIPLLLVTMVASFAAYVYYSMRRGTVSDQALFLQMGAAGGTAAVVAAALLRPGSIGIATSVVVVAIAMLPGFLILACRNGELRSAPIRLFGLLLAAVLTAALVAAYLPHKPFVAFEHYLLLLVFPITMSMAWPVLALSSDRGRRSPLPFLLIFATLTLAGQVCEAGSPDFIPFSDFHRTVQPLGSRVIESFTEPTDGIAVWGWDSPAYLGAGRAAATKDIVTVQLCYPTFKKIRAYYREAYVSGLRVQRPKLFVDAIDSSWWRSDGKQFDFETIPEIDTYIQSNYAHVLDAYGQRYYVRRDLAPSLAGIGQLRKCDRDALRCFEAGVHTWIPADLPPIQMPEHAIVETVFTPETEQDLHATVFSNAASPTAHAGFIFQHVEADRYRLVVAGAAGWAFSKELSLPQRVPVSLAVEFKGNVVTVVCNGTKRDEMRLPERMADSPSPITVGSSVNHQRPFRGDVQFFQIRSLGPA